MAAFFTKGRAIEAWQNTGAPEQENPTPEWFSKAAKDEVVEYRPSSGSFLIKFPGDESQVARRGDWIIRERSGDLWACPPDLFRSSFKAAA